MYPNTFGNKSRLLRFKGLRRIYSVIEMGKMADLLYELQQYERMEIELEALKKKEEEYKEEIKRLEEENMKVKEMFLELFRSKSDA